MPFRLLLLSAIFMFAGAYGARMLIAINRQRLALFNETVAATVNVILNLGLIPSLGATGSAVAMLATVIIAATLHLWVIYKATHVSPVVQMQARIVSAAALSGVVMWLIGQSVWWLGLVCGLAVYPFGLTALRVVTLADVLALIQRRTPNTVKA